jgi:hypothetical protein
LLLYCKEEEYILKNGEILKEKEKKFKICEVQNIWKIPDEIKNMPKG